MHTVTKARISLVLLLVLLAPFGCGGAPTEEHASALTGAEETAGIETEPTTLPDTPAGRQLTWVVTVINDEAGDVTPDDVGSRLSPTFLEVVGAPAIHALLVELRDTEGPFRLHSLAAESTDTDLIAFLSAADDSVFRAHVVTTGESPHPINGFSFRPAFWLNPGLPDTWDGVAELLRATAPRVNLLASEIVEDGLNRIYGVDEDRQLGIGSSFKLYVLATLTAEIRDGERSWDDLLAIRDEWRTLPTGDMQYSDTGAEFTLRHFAEKMISISDNTATDHLLLTLGRENVEAMMRETGHAQPELNTPMMTVREFAQAKLFATDEQRAAYLAGSYDERLAILEQWSADFSLAGALFAAGFWVEPKHIDTFEWFASPTDLTHVMHHIYELSQSEAAAPVLEVLSINPGIPYDTSTWTYLGYKGGGEPGVINMNYLLRRKDDRWFILSVGLNNPETDIDLEPVIEIASAALNMLARE